MNKTNKINKVVNHRVKIKESEKKNHLVAWTLPED